MPANASGNAFPNGLRIIVMEELIFIRLLGKIANNRDSIRTATSPKVNADLIYIIYIIGGGEAGIETRWGWNFGASVSGKGILEYSRNSVNYPHQRWGLVVPL